MTVTLELSPEAEADLRERAEKRGQSVADYLLTLDEWQDYADLSLSEETIAVIEEGLADFHAGDRGLSMEEFRAEMMTTIAHLKPRQAEAAIGTRVHHLGHA